MWKKACVAFTMVCALSLPVINPDTTTPIHQTPQRIYDTIVPKTVHASTRIEIRYVVYDNVRGYYPWVPSINGWNISISKNPSMSINFNLSDNIPKGTAVNFFPNTRFIRGLPTVIGRYVMVGVGSNYRYVDRNSLGTQPAR